MFLSRKTALLYSIPAKEKPYWFLTIALVFILVVSQLFQDGMFMDGELYVCVSKNLANGSGSFWNPYFGETSGLAFHEQPPLYFGLMALFFKLLGNSMYTERIFCLLTLFVTTLYIVKIWRLVFREDEAIAAKSWLPVLLWITIPVCFWTYNNLVEETVMGVFTTMAVYFILKSLLIKARTLLNLFLGAVFIFLASLTKGIQGMYPIVAPALFWLAIPSKISFKKSLAYSMVLLLIPLISYTLLVCNPTVYGAYELYFKSRFVSALNGSAATTGNRFRLVYNLFCQLIPALSFGAIILILGKTRKTASSGSPLFSTAMSRSDLNRTPFYLLLIGLSGSLPLMVTLEQREFYIATTLPFFALSISVFIVPVLSALLDSFNARPLGFRIFNLVATLLLLSSLLFTLSQLGKTKRDAELLQDIRGIDKTIPDGETLSSSLDLMEAWDVRTYFNRYRNVNLCPVSAHNTKNHLVKFKSSVVDSSLLSKYEKVQMESTVLDLYKLK